MSLLFAPNRTRSACQHKEQSFNLSWIRKSHRQEKVEFLLSIAKRICDRFRADLVEQDLKFKALTTLGEEISSARYESEFSTWRYASTC